MIYKYTAVKWKDVHWIYLGRECAYYPRLQQFKGLSAYMRLLKYETTVSGTPYFFVLFK